MTEKRAGMPSDTKATRTSGTDEEEQSGRVRGLRRNRRVVIATAVVAAAATAAVDQTLLTWPDVARLVRERPDTTAFMRLYLERRAAEPELPPIRHRWVPMSQISEHLKRAVVSAEDMEFFHHGT